MGSYHSKSHFLGLRKRILEPIFSLEWDFEDLKNDFLSDMTPIFFELSAHKGFIYTWKKKFLESDNCKWSKMTLKVGRLSRPHSPLLHGEIGKLWKDESPEHCAANLLHTGEGAGGVSTSKHEIS